MNISIGLIIVIKNILNYGPGGSNEMNNLPYCKDALILMVVTYNAHWKIAVGYYIINQH